MNSSDEESKQVYGEFFGILLVVHPWTIPNTISKITISSSSITTSFFSLNNYFLELTFLIIISYLF
jgi:hypothetical protein